MRLLGAVPREQAANHFPIPPYGSGEAARQSTAGNADPLPVPLGKGQPLESSSLQGEAAHWPAVPLRVLRRGYRDQSLPRALPRGA